MNRIHTCDLYQNHWKFGFSFERYSSEIVLYSMKTLAWVSGVSGGKRERWKRKRERAEGAQMLLLEPSTPTQHDSISSNQNQFRLLGCRQAVCVTTHKGSWVKLLLCLISIVTLSSSHLVREMNQTQGSKHCCLFWKTTEESNLENFQDLIVALDACYWLHKTISISSSRFEDDRAI